MSIRTSLKKVLPPISVTEQEALDAGDVWIESSIYQGKPDMHALRSLPQAILSADEQAFLDGPVEELLAMINDFELANSEHIPQEILDFLGKNKFFSMIIPKRFGGLEFSPYANSTIVATIAATSGAIAVTVMVPNSLGPGELLMQTFPGISSRELRARMFRMSLIAQNVQGIQCTNFARESSG